MYKPPDSRTDSYFIYSYYCNNAAKLRLSGIAQILQESAWLHAEDCKLGFSDLKEDSLLWVLSGLKIKIYETPCWGDTLELKTWGRDYDSLFANRDFRITGGDESGLRIEATSSWLIIDAESRRPKRITGEMKKIPMYPDPLELSKPGKIQLPGKAVSIQRRKVLYSDIDIYNHVNNTRYIQWCIDSLDDYHQGKIKIEDFEIRFISETHLGEEVSVHVEKSGSVYFFSAFNETTSKEIFRAKANYSVI